MVGSERSFTATDLSKRTDRTSYSIPDDGRAVTIQTDRRRRRKDDNHSVLSQGTNASLLIEYFENAKAGSGSSGRHPSVRVKVTPSAAKRHRVNQSADGNGIEISDVGTGEKDTNGRRPTHTHRIQLTPSSNGDDSRPTLGAQGRSYSGDHSTLSSLSGADESSFTRGGLNVSIIRESNSPGSVRGDNDYADRRRRRRTANGAATDFHEDTYRISKQQRSRSVSRESEIYQEPAFKTKLSRRRSRSLSRERLPLSQKEKIERAIREEVQGTLHPYGRKERSKSRSKGLDNDGLKPPHARRRSRSRDVPIDEIAAEKVRARRKAAEIEGHDNQSTISSRNGTNNPALVELIRGTIRELLLPEIEEMKANQHKGTTRAGFEGTISRNLSVLSTRGPGRATSMPEVKPMVVLTPESGMNGIVISGREHEEEVRDYTDFTLDFLTSIRKYTTGTRPGLESQTRRFTRSLARACRSWGRCLARAPSRCPRTRTAPKRLKNTLKPDCRFLRQTVGFRIRPTRTCQAAETRRPLASARRCRSFLS